MNFMSSEMLYIYKISYKNESNEKKRISNPYGSISFKWLQ